MSRAFLLIALLAPTIATAAHSRRAVIAPIAVAGRDPAEAKLCGQLERALVDATRAIVDVELVNFEGGKLKGPSKLDAKADPRPETRALALARDSNAELAISAEPQPLADGAIVYLHVADGAGNVRGSTAVAISADMLKAGGTELERPLRGGLVQILDPQAFVGRLDLRVDVKGAQLEIDGRAIAWPEQGRGIPLSVGPHAVRVIQPAYRDYLRFVEIGFDRSEVQQVALAAFPLTEGEMNEKLKRAVSPKTRVPWYRSWWALSITGVVLVGATAGIVYGARPSISWDHGASYRVVPAP